MSVFQSRCQFERLLQQSVEINCISYLLICHRPCGFHLSEMIFANFGSLSEDTDLGCVLGVNKSNVFGFMLNRILFNIICLRAVICICTFFKVH